MKAKAHTLNEVIILKEQQMEEERRKRELAELGRNLPEVAEVEIILSPQDFQELPEDEGIIFNWFKRKGIESNTTLYRAFNEKTDQIYQARNNRLDMLRQYDAMDEIRRQRELSKIDHIIALKERRVHLDFLNEIETSKKEFILAAITRMIEEHKSETRLQIAKANARARDYEDS